MNVLILHNRYEFKGGEDVYIDEIETVFKKQPHQVNVRVFTVSNRDIAQKSFFKKISIIFNVVYSFIYKKQILEIVKDFKPDIIHIHNLFFLFGPGIIRKLYKLGIPMVMTLHNHRLICINGLALRNGKHCRRCDRSLGIRPLIYNCNGNIFKSFIYWLGFFIHRNLGTFNLINKFISPSQYMKNVYVEAGIPNYKIAVVSNFSIITEQKPLKASKRRSNSLFLGRFSHEKGVHILFEAATRLPEITFIMAGTGAIKFHNIPKNVKFVGYLKSKEEIYKTFAHTKCLVLPSICNETAALSAIEAVSCGIPVVVSRIGGLEELPLADKFSFRAGDVNDLVKRIKEMYNQSFDQYKILSGKVRTVALERYSPARHGEKLFELYRSILYT